MTRLTSTPINGVILLDPEALHDQRDREYPDFVEALA